MSSKLTPMTPSTRRELVGNPGIVGVAMALSLGAVK